MKKTVTFRFDPTLLERARAKAREDNRTLTNFIETVLKKEVDAASDSHQNADQPIQIVRGE
jgi:predicted HicB family RNase H-like nuclease